MGLKDQAIKSVLIQLMKQVQKNVSDITNRKQSSESELESKTLDFPSSTIFPAAALTKEKMFPAGLFCARCCVWRQKYIRLCFFPIKGLKSR